jgi:hypothetical protein
MVQNINFAGKSITQDKFNILLTCKNKNLSRTSYFLAKPNLDTISFISFQKNQSI